MRKISLAVMITLFIAFLLSACQSGTEEPAIKISTATEELTPIYFGDFSYDEEDIVQRIRDYMVGKRFIDLPTIAYGDVIQLEALNFETTEFEIYDYVLDENGYIISEYDQSSLTLSKLEGGKTEFAFEEIHNYKHYREYAIDEKLIHSLFITCKIDNSTFAFSTIVICE